MSLSQLLDATAVPLVLLAAVHVSRRTFELAKFGRIASYRMWSSKIVGVLLVATGVRMLSTGRPTALAAVTVWVAVANALEGFAASAILPAWKPDVPSLFHALRR